MTTKVQVIFGNEDNEQQWNTLELDKSIEFTATTFTQFTESTRENDMVLIFAPTSSSNDEIFVTKNDLISLAPVVGVVTEAPAEFLREKFGQETVSATLAEDVSATVNNLVARMRLNLNSIVQ